MHLAAQEGLPLQLHVEGESEDTYPDLAREPFVRVWTCKIGPPLLAS